MTWAPAAAKRYRFWPLRSIRDPAQPPARTPEESVLFQNCYAQDTEVGPLIVGRPGVTLMGTGGTAQLGATTVRNGQLVCQFTKRSGTTYTVVIVGGKFYTYNWSTEAFTEVVSAANFTTAVITLSSTARCYAVAFADTLVVSDGVNLPWTWDGQSGAGGLTSLTNAAIAYGPPVVYYAKLFLVKNSARSTLIWCEEGTPNTGYEAGGYNNAWDLVQTSTEGLQALAATDSALYAFRSNSITSISGPVSTDFKTTGTREAVSDRVGTLSPASVQVINGRVWFMDQFGRLQTTRGGEPAEVGTGARTLTRQIPAPNYPDVQLVDDPETGHVRCYCSESGKDYPNFAVWLDRDTGDYRSFESGYEGTRFGTCLDGSGLPVIVHVGGGTATTVDSSAGGYVYHHGHPTGGVWTDGLAVSDEPIQHGVETPFAGHDVDVEKVFRRGEISLLNPTALSGLQVAFTTPYGTSDTLTLDDISSAGAQFGIAQFGVDEFATSGGEQKRTVQMRQRGRWCRVQLTHAELAEQFAISEIVLEGVPVSRRPGIR